MTEFAIFLFITTLTLSIITDPNSMQDVWWWIYDDEYEYDEYSMQDVCHIWTK